MTNETTRDNILLVDDEKMLSKSLARILQNKGYEVCIANNGSEGIDWLEKKEFDLCITDLAMPGVGGVDFLAYISKQEKLRNMPVIVHSAFINFLDNNDTTKMKVRRFLKKPVPIEVLMDSVKELIV